MTALLNIVFYSGWTYCGSIFILLLLMLLVHDALYFGFKSWNRWLRMKNIKNAGWPPAHCDADGEPPDPHGSIFTGPPK